MKTYKRLRAVVSMDAIKHNLDKMHENIGEDAKIIAVIKMDAYGHGSVPISKQMEKIDYIWGYGVALVEEGHLLRKAGIKKPIISLGVVFNDQFEKVVEDEIRMTTFNMERAKRLSEVATRLGKTAYVHIKIDTGMSRIGFAVNKESIEEIKEIAKLPNIKMEGMYTHFAKADEFDKSATKEQMERFVWMREQLKKEGIEFEYYHAANSATIIDMPEYKMDLVRAGIATYGLYPSDEVKKDVLDLQPAMELKAHVSYVKWVEAGTPISYGGTFVTKRRTKVATIPTGYGDGYPRSLSNKGYVLIEGKKAPILGRVCMDQFMVDVTDIEDVEFGTTATLFGWSGDAYLSLEELANLSDRFNYEFICDINKRVPREIVSKGKIIDQVDYF